MPKLHVKGGLSKRPAWNFSSSGLPVLHLLQKTLRLRFLQICVPVTQTKKPPGKQVRAPHGLSCCRQLGNHGSGKGVCCADFGPDQNPKFSWTGQGMGCQNSTLKMAFPPMNSHRRCELRRACSPRAEEVRDAPVWGQICEGG